MLIAAGARLPDHVCGGDAVRTSFDGPACPMESEAMSKTRLFQSIKSLNREAAAALLEADPELKGAKDERGRNALHFLCSLPGADKGRERSLELAQYLLGLGFDIDQPAFVEGPFKAPLWYAVSPGRNPPLENAEGIRPLDMVAKRRDKTLFELFSKRASAKRTSAKAR